MTVFLVDSTADSGSGTLREAISDVDGDNNDSPSAPDQIVFSLTPPNGLTLATITLDSPLPPITKPVSIEGYTQSGSSTNATSNTNSAETDIAVINVQVDAPGVSPTATQPGLFTVIAANTSISGLAITSFEGPAIALLPPPNSPNGSVGDDIWGNFIGVDSFDPSSFNELPVDTATSTPTDWTHVNALGNDEGILVESSNNRIGGTLPPDRNIIQGNHGDGVQLTSVTGTGNLVEGNYILDNDADGVDVTTSNNEIGEAIGAGPAGAGNIISGNNYGVAIVGPSASGNILVDNEIGTNVGLENVTPGIRGMTARPNRYDGVLIQDAPGNVVGGLLSDSLNVIAANGQDGISIENVATQDATGNIVQGNYIGFNERNDTIAILPNRDGINISSANNTIGGLTTAARNYIALNARNGITISSVTLDTSNLTPVAIVNADPTGNFVAGNYIGTVGGGDDQGNTLDGILIDDANGNTIGGTVAGAQNVISGNNDGVVINDDGAGAYASTGNVVAGNDIGLMSDDTTPLPNSIDGVLVDNAADNTIGGTVSAAANLLSGNNNGLHLTGSGALDNVVEGNFIGTDSLGTTAARNAVDGVLIDNGASHNTIGGTSPATRNIISGNDTGLVITGLASTGNVVAGNYVGVAVGGTTALPNAVDGVSIASPGNTVGGTVAGATNVISGNFVGLELTSANATGNVVEGNDIGTDASGANPVPNSSDGILIDTSATGNTIGGTAAVDGNIIAFNGGNGVNVTAGPGNTILSNQIASNGLLGIAGTNGLLSAFTLTSVTSTNGISTVIQGAFTSTTQAPFLLQFFINSANASSTYNYEGQTEIATQTVTSNGTSPTSFTVTVPSVLTAGQFVTFTATGSDGTTSEFSAGEQVSSATQPMVYTVTNTNDSGPGSLRQAIEDVNLPQDLLPSQNDKIVFDIPGAGQQTINLLSPLPVIINPVAIEGYTQPGSTPNEPTVTTQTGQSTGQSSSLGTSSTSGAGLNSTTTTISATGQVTTVTTNADDFNAVINIRLDGSNAVPVAGETLGLLTIAALNSQVSGLSITGYSSGPAILLEPASANTGGIGDTIFGNIIGEAAFVATNNSSTPATNPVGNAEGIVVESADNVIGGEVLNIGIPLPTTLGSAGSAQTALGANVIQGNDGPGLVFQGTGASGNVVTANFILDNEADGVLITTSNNFIGEAAPGQGNVISGNGDNGVDIDGATAAGNVVVNNEIGTNPDGVTPRPNLENGILIQDAPGNIIGGALGQSPNVIGANGDDGVSIQNGAAQNAIGNLVEGNLIGWSNLGSNTAILPNRDGINISSADNTVENNKIGYNWRNGITITSSLLDSENNATTPIADADPTGNIVEGNSIGTTDGTTAAGNTLDGILIEDAANNTVGGTTSAAQNVISGNNRGVVINDDTATHDASTGNLIEGNLIGTMADGVTVLGNAVDGVWIDNAASNTVGGTVTGSTNVISGNNDGVELSGSSATANVVEGNDIGTDATGAIAVRNAADGVLIDGDASGNSIGGTATGAGNTIAFNVGSGVAVSSGTDDAILSNSIFSNDRIGIDLVVPGDPADGVTPNQTAPATGPNDLLNYPNVAYVASDGSESTSIQGTFVGAPGQTYLLQFFSSPTTDPSGYGQGKTYLGATEVTLTGTSAKQFVTAPFDAELAVGLAVGQDVSATATVMTSSANAPYGDTSEFSGTVPSIAVQVGFSASSYSVNQTAGTATITVTRSGGTGEANGTVTVGYSVSGGTAVAGTNYTAVPDGTLTFGPGVNSQTITIPLINDDAVAPSTTLNVTLSDPTGGATIATPNPVTLTIANTNVPDVQFNIANYSVNEDAGTATIVVSRNTGEGSAAVAYATANGTAVAGVDYTAVSGTLDFAAGETSRSFTVPILDASKVGGSVTANLLLSNATGASLGNPSDATLTINDNDSAGALQFNNVTYGAAATADSALITVTRTGGLGGTVTVHYATGGGTAVAGQDYAATSGTLTFNPGQATQTFTVPVLNHQLTGSVTVGLTLTGPTGSATLGPITSATLSITQNAVVTPVQAGNTPGPEITDFQLQSNGQAITGIELSFNEALDPTRAQNLANYGYYLLAAGRDNTFGTNDDYSVAIASATYNPATFQVLITPVVPLALGQIFKLDVNTLASVPLQTGLTDTAGNLLDGAYNGHSGTPYVTEFGLGSTLQYVDGSNNRVTLQLSRGGTMALQLADNGNAEELAIIGPVPGKSTLSGQVRGARRASTTIAVIETAPGVRIRLRPPAFHIGQLDTAAVDAVLARHGRR